MYIRKTQQPSDYPANSIHDSYSTSSTDTYSCHYINEINNYSISEINTGKKWIDNKAIYRKVIDCGNMPNTNQFKEINTGIINLDRIINIQLSLATNSFTFEEKRFGLLFTKSTGIFKITSTYNATDYYGYAIIEYTKTTN